MQVSSSPLILHIVCRFKKKQMSIFMTKSEAQWRKRRSDKIRSKMPHIFDIILDNGDTVHRVGLQTTETKSKK